MTKPDPISGPLSREELRALVDAPYGKAASVIRKHDPLFGRAEGEKIEWTVEATAECLGRAYIKAADEVEAKQEALRLNSADFDWEPIRDHQIDIGSVEPA